VAVLAVEEEPAVLAVEEVAEEEYVEESAAEESADSATSEQFGTIEDAGSPSPTHADEAGPDDRE